MLQKAERHMKCRREKLKQIVQNDTLHLGIFVYYESEVAPLLCHILSCDRREESAEECFIIVMPEMEDSV